MMTMKGGGTVVCVKRVKKGMPEEEWDEGMPLPGDVIDGFAVEEEAAAEPVRGRSELSSRLSRLGRRSGPVWVRVRRGESVLNLRARIAPDPERDSRLQRRYTIQAARDDRHVVVLADLGLDEVTELQEKSRRVVNMDMARFHSQGANYDWKKKVDIHLPDRRSTVISSIVVMPFHDEQAIESVTIRSMAWFSAAVSSGVPLVFVNIQTEQVITSDKTTSSRITVDRTPWKTISRCIQQIPKASIKIELGIRLWFLPGIAELPVVLSIELGETRFGLDIRRTAEVRSHGFICINSVSKGLAADRAGIGKMCIQAGKNGNLVVISRMDGSSVIPSMVTSNGLIHCCDHMRFKDRILAAIERVEDVHLHIMACPISKNKSPITHQQSSAVLWPPVDRGL